MARADAGDRFERLEHLVRDVVQRFQLLRAEHADLRQRLAEREARIRELDEQILQLNQTRRDAGKRLDDLISQLDHLEARLGSSPAGSSASGSE